MRYVSLATQWMVMLGLAVWLGYKLDQYLGWKFPLFVVLFPVVSLAASLWQLIRELNNNK